MTEREKIIAEYCNATIKAKQNSRDELIKRYYDCDARFQREKLKRNIATMLAYDVLYFFILCQMARISGVLHILILLLVSTISAIFTFWVNLSTFGYLLAKGREESDILKHITESIHEIDSQKIPKYTDIINDIEFDERYEKRWREARLKQSVSQRGNVNDELTKNQ